MNYILFDDNDRDHMLPLTFMRPTALIRCGILTFVEKWEYVLQCKPSFHTSAYLREKFPLQIYEQNMYINGLVFPDETLMQKISELSPGKALISTETNTLIAFAADLEQTQKLKFSQNDVFKVDYLNGFEFQIYAGDIRKISRPWDIFSMNDFAIRDDYARITAGRTSASISTTNRVSGSENVFVEPGAVVEYSVINARTGPVYIGFDSEIMENCSIRGPFAMCSSSVLKMGAKIYGPTTIGPQCKVGGEVSNSVFFGYSNKAHDGFLGNSVIAEWCNLGADTNNSNLKNTYDIVKLWSYPEKHFVSTGLQFCGLIMGDHSKSSINTMFNTGTVVGVSANIFGDGFPRNFIPSFSWGGAAGMKKFNFQKAIEVARAVCDRRNVILSDADLKIFETLYAMSDE